MAPAPWALAARPSAHEQYSIMRLDGVPAGLSCAIFSSRAAARWLLDCIARPAAGGPAAPGPAARGLWLPVATFGACCPLAFGLIAHC